MPPWLCHQDALSAAMTVMAGEAVAVVGAHPRGARRPPPPLANFPRKVKYKASIWGRQRRTCAFARRGHAAPSPSSPSTLRFYCASLGGGAVCKWCLFFDASLPPTPLSPSTTPHFYY
ncbi:hypothetical protein I4F81_006134 [Pyropia yezoensis]|uniref:Uncharacterized protein n=1 Tax=Pyropia yezoensis TaxID=2788 RepID=A0ACC3C030_PYRYE|nr:hypothetical protein I4F81_006134 [Neopyropia yezoensis]